MPEQNQTIMKTKIELKESPFTDELFKDGATVSVNGKPMQRAYWNLQLSRRDLKLYLFSNIRPHRHWKISDVKWYFGIKGTGKNLYKNFLDIYKVVVEAMGQEIPEPDQEFLNENK